MKQGRVLPDDEIVYDTHGRPLTDEYVDQLVQDAMITYERRGRPPLSATQSGPSPTIRIRVSQELGEAVDAAAARVHLSRSEWVRRTLIEAVAQQTKADTAVQHGNSPA